MFSRFWNILLINFIILEEIFDYTYNIIIHEKLPNIIC